MIRNGGAAHAKVICKNVPGIIVHIYLVSFWKGQKGQKGWVGVGRF